jgi:hypothetical protein
MPQRFRFFLQILEVLRIGDLGHVTRLLGLVNLDTEDLDLVFEMLLTGGDLVGHPLEDPG